MLGNRKIAGHFYFMNLPTYGGTDYHLGDN